MKSVLTFTSDDVLQILCDYAQAKGYRVDRLNMFHCIPSIEITLFPPEGPGPANLLPCPLCGSKDLGIYNTEDSMRSINCHSCLLESPDFADDEEATGYWNRARYPREGGAS